MMYDTARSCPGLFASTIYCLTWSMFWGNPVPKGGLLEGGRLSTLFCNVLSLSALAYHLPSIRDTWASAGTQLGGMRHSALTGST
ncbi:hypothetical protein BDN71DRAFT_776480 [Pleurotus eryngii]|uniref:Uncharacterized protein n=1 Tax=Pleurotus eryngii TaxID=5323 RepID=A0A9P5ZG80_PLEER|nr:hypothetical protein BDN71DRAFT_776480 [Pleurotus eryngii]